MAIAHMALSDKLSHIDKGRIKEVLSDEMQYKRHNQTGRREII